MKKRYAFVYLYLLTSVSTAGLRERLMEDVDVKKAFDYCEKQHQDSLDQCIWDQLSDDKKKKLKEFFSKNEKNRFESVDVIPDKKKETMDPAFNKLQEYLYQRLEEALYGDVQKKVKRVVDRVVFIKLYKAHLGKDIIRTLSSYCIETDSSCMGQKDDCTYMIRKEDRERNKARNIKKLQEFTFDRKKSDAAIYWERCITEIQNICYKSKGMEWDYSKRRACAVVEHIKATRQNLILSSKIEKGYENIKKGISFESNAEVYTGRNGQKSIEELTSITSNELINTSGFKEETEKLMKKIQEQCKKPDSKECSQHFPSDEKEDKEVIDEYRIRTLALKKTLENMDKDDIRQYLREEGYEENQIRKMLLDSEEKIKEEINQRYSEMRKEIMAGLQDEMKKSSDQTNEEKAIDIYRELSNRGESFKQLIHYNNIVSGYLKFKSDDSSQEGRGLWLIRRELENSAYDDEDFKERKATLLKSISDQGYQMEEENLLLDIEEINQNLLYYPSPAP